MTTERPTATPPLLSAMLVDARVACACTVAQVEEATQVRADYITALERGSFHELPPDIYARRILLSLVAFYGLDEAQVLLQYEAERAAFLRTEESFRALKLDRLPGTPLETTLPVSSRPIHAYRLIGVGASVLAVLALSGYVAHQVGSFSSAPALTLEEPSGDVQVNHRTIIVRGRADVGSTVSINNQAVLTDESGSFQADYELSPGQNFITVVAQKKNGKSARISHTVTADFADTAVAQPERGFLAVVSAAERTWVRVKLDGQVAFEGTVEPQADRSFSGQQDIRIQTGNAGATRIAINGQDQGPVGREGHSGLFSYTNPSTVGMAGTPAPATITR